jgi:hypothetical protein
MVSGTVMVWLTPPVPEPAMVTVYDPVGVASGAWLPQAVTPESRTPREMKMATVRTRADRRMFLRRRVPATPSSRKREPAGSRAKRIAEEEDRGCDSAKSAWVMTLRVAVAGIPVPSSRMAFGATVQVAKVGRPVQVTLTDPE